MLVVLGFLILSPVAELLGKIVIVLIKNVLYPRKTVYNTIREITFTALHKAFKNVVVNNIIFRIFQK